MDRPVWHGHSDVEPADIDAWLAQLLDEVGARAGTVHVRGPEQLHLVAAVNIPESVQRVTARIPRGKGMAGVAWERSTPVQTCNLQTDDSGDVRPGARAVDAQAAVAVPVTGDGGELAAVVGVAFDEYRELSEEEVARITAPARAVPLPATRSAAESYLDIAAQRCASEVAEWLRARFYALGPPFEKRAFGVGYAGAGRRAGAAEVTLAPVERATVARAGALEPEGWALHEVARAALLLRATEVMPADDQASFVRGMFMRGDNGERHALLRTLSMLPDPAQHVDTAVEACRTNVQTIFEAIACDNPYPARHFPDRNFNQLVLKALFIGSPLQRVQGLPERVTPELVRMVQDYASERRAAGRSVPEDVALVEELGRGTS